MNRILQPCDWHEHDVAGKYVVDVYGRTDQGNVACLRINGFRPYFYVKTSNLPKNGTLVQKYDVFAGFSELKPVNVYKISCSSKKEFMDEAKKHSNAKLYETNLPPFLRLFHERHLGPASPIRFVEHKYSIPCDKDTELPLYNIDAFYQCTVDEVTPSPESSIPLKVACYDLEMYSESGLFPRAKEGDPIIQIGISYRWSNDMVTPIRRVVFVVGSVEEPEESDVTYIPCKTEEDMLFKYAHEIRMQNPDVLCGYNIFGFDDAYIEDRCEQLGILDDISFSRSPPVMMPTSNGNFKRKFSETKKFELASGKYDLRFLTMRGRLGLDLLLNMRREHNLDSYKLDSVASVFLRDKVIRSIYSGVSTKRGMEIKTKSVRGLREGNYVRFEIAGNTTDPYNDGAKYKVTAVWPSTQTFRIDAPELFKDLSDKERAQLEWTFTKDDVEPHELFRLHAEGGPEGRGRIAKYCIQDCDLVLTLMAKLDTIVNARGMADVCKVPMEYVLRRGQGIKIFSAVLYYASQRNQIIQTQAAIDDDTGYEGAIVISPKIGMYLDQPISVLDFNSLYPTNMIAYNLSPDTLVSIRVFDAEGHLLSSQCEGYKKEDFARLEEAGFVLEEVEYDNKDDKGVIIGKTKCTFLQPDPANPMSEGILPKTLDILLKKRKEFKEKMEDLQYDEAQRSVFNGLQLAYKVVANSVYGQTGSRTSPIRKVPVAACTTAAGRNALGIARRVVETEFSAEVVYGDTDSIFVKFPTKDLAESIRLGIAAGKSITSQCRRPYKIAYEKTFFPFILFCRKRYVGMMFEEDANAKPKRKSMGIVLKRRDNAPIVKDVFGGALDVLMQEQNVKKAQSFVNQKLVDVLENRIPLEKFIVSKSLRDDYKNPDQIAHRVLADRMEKRDPGTAPKVGDRLQFVYVAENKDKHKQGDRIEEVGYVRTNKLTPDTRFYITNQLQNPVAQLFALCIEQLDGYVAPRRPSYGTLMDQMMEKYHDEEEATLAVLKKKEKQLEDLMFLGSTHLSKIIKRNTRGPMDAFVQRKELS